MQRSVLWAMVVVGSGLGTLSKPFSASYAQEGNPPREREGDRPRESREAERFRPELRRVKIDQLRVEARQALTKLKQAEANYKQIMAKLRTLEGDRPREGVRPSPEATFRRDRDPRRESIHSPKRESEARREGDRPRGDRPREGDLRPPRARPFPPFPPEHAEGMFRPILVELRRMKEQLEQVQKQLNEMQRQSERQQQDRRLLLDQLKRKLQGPDADGGN